MRTPLHILTTSALCLLCALQMACDKPAADNTSDASTPDTTTPPPEADVVEKSKDTPEQEENKKTPVKDTSTERIKKSLEEAHNTKKGTELRKTFITHLKAGRKLVQKKDYKAGLVELEKARSIDPNDPRILSEIGFAAMLADDLTVARKANLDSVRFAKEDNLKAASLYNLGRIAEKESDTAAAIGYYQQSLELRPNKTVEARLATLNGVPAGDAPGSTPEACDFEVHAGKSKEEVCQAVAKAQHLTKPVCGKSERYSVVSDLEKTSFDASEVGFDKIELIHFYDEDDDMTEIFHLGVLDKKGTWHTVPLYWVYNPGAFGIMESLAQPKVSFEKLMGDDTTQVVVRVGHHRHDSDMGLAEIESEDTTGIIVIGANGDGTPKLLANFTDTYKYLREKLDFEGEEGFDPGPGTKGLPIEESFDYGASFDKKGNIVLKSVKEKGSLKAGNHALGAPELRICSFSNGY